VFKFADFAAAQALNAPPTRSPLRSRPANGTIDLFFNITDLPAQ
jgi:hypothetical protein